MNRQLITRILVGMGGVGLATLVAHAFENINIIIALVGGGLGGVVYWYFVDVPKGKP
jgi:hypothetical protein